MAALGRRGVRPVREGGRHTVVESVAGKRSSVPRHSELSRGTTQKIVKQLDLDWEDVKKDLS